MRKSHSKYFSVLPNQRSPFVEMEWVLKKSPRILIRNVETLEQLQKKLEFIRNQTTKISQQERNQFHFDINLSNVWKIITTVILPIFWIFVSFQIMKELFTELYSQFAFLTLLLLLVVSLTFSSPLFYVIARRRQDQYDEVDQLHLLNAIITNNSDKSDSDLLNDILYLEEGDFKWRKYQSNWDLSLFYPEFTIMDIIGLFTSLFSVIYLLTWLIKVLGILTISKNKTAFREAVLYLDFLLILIFLGFICVGVWYGMKSHWSMYWDEPWVNKPIITSFILLGIGIVGTIIIELITDQFIGTFVFFILMFEIPLISSFIVNRIRLFVEFNQARLNLLRVITIDSFETGEKLKNMQNREVDMLQNRNLINYEIFKTLLEKTPIPSTRIRSYTLLFTAIFSLLTTILTVFIGSTELFTEIINSLFS